MKKRSSTRRRPIIRRKRTTRATTRRPRRGIIRRTGRFVGRTASRTYKTGRGAVESSLRIL